jgi:hypothetical protein
MQRRPSGRAKAQIGAACDQVGVGHSGRCGVSDILSWLSVFDLGGTSLLVSLGEATDF